jgi:uncharacterized pyridoxal phosphate-containing UPF0001 family protein
MTTSPASSADQLVQRVADNLATCAHASPPPVATSHRFASSRSPRPSASTPCARRWSNGLADLGENYVDELCEKRAQCDDAAITWHYLGALQSNKVRRVVECADVVCGVSRVKELERIATFAPSRRLYVQVDYTGAPERNGAPEGDVAKLVTRGARELGLACDGLMTVAPNDRDGARRAFRSLARVGRRTRSGGTCSMGMSDDLELACEFGTSEVRIGRALFGARDATLSLLT